METDQTEQMNPHKPVGVNEAFHRSRVQGKLLSRTQAPYRKRFLWNEGTCKSIPESDENVNAKENESTVKERPLGQRGALVMREKNSDVIESSEKVNILGIQSANKQQPSEPQSHFRKPFRRRSFAPHLMSTEVLSPKDPIDTVYGGDEIRKEDIRVSKAAFLLENQDGGSKAEPDESFGLKFQSRFRRRSRLHLQKENLEVDTQSESQPSFRNPFRRRSCAARFMSTEALSPKDTVGTAYGGENTATSSRFSSGNQDDGSTAELASIAPEFGLKFQSRFRRRNFRLLQQKENLEAETKCENEHLSRSVSIKEEERIREETTTANYGSSHLGRSSVKMEDKPQEVEHDKKSEHEGHTIRPARKSLADASKNVKLAGNSAYGSQSNQLTPFTSLGPGNQQKAPRATNKAGREEPQEECRRVLQFESDSNEDSAAPLTMTAKTLITSRASVLQNRASQEQQKDILKPVIKRSPLDKNVNISRFRRRWSTRIHNQVEGGSEQSCQNKELKISTPGTFVSNKCESSSNAVLLEHNKEPENIDFKCALQNTTIRNCDADVGGSTEACTDLMALRKVKFLQHSGSTKRIQRRRSVAVLGVRTPLRKKIPNLEAKDTSKFINSSFSPKTLGQNHGRRRSLAVTDNLSLQNQMTNKMALSDYEGVKENKESMSEYKPQKVDASTNTTISLSHIKIVDLKILETIENLLVEQIKLNNTAHVSQENPSARCLEMEKNLMENLVTSISPLRRLKAVFSENLVSTDSGRGCQEDPRLCKAIGGDAVCEGDAQEPQVISNKSEMGRECARAAAITGGPRTQWRQWHRDDNRLVRTTSWESTAEEEEFLSAEQGSMSPFTTLVGDCERPSLAPMTPHSRRNVSLLKLSLKEQLDKLYEN